MWVGNATLVQELSEQTQKPGAIVVAVGGGGLLCGVLHGLDAVWTSQSLLYSPCKAGWSDVPVIAMETEGAASFAAAMKAGVLVASECVL